MATSVAPAARRKIAQLALLLFAAPALSDDCSIESLSPVAGPTSGGTHVNVTGTDLGDGPTWECSFGSAVEAAEYSDPEDHVECNSPEAAAGAVAFGVRMGGTPCAQSLSYEFYAPPNVSGISPASGSLQGGTTVTVTGSGFDAMGAAHCAFGSLTVGDEKMVAGALVPATTIDAHTLECDAPTADRADAVGTAVFNFNEMPPYEVVRPCDFDTCVTPPVRRFRFDNGHNVTLLGDAFHETRQQSLLSGVIKLTENLFLLRGSMVISLYTPGHAAGTPVRAFEASWTHYIGRGNGADGYSFCFGDLRDEDGGELLYAFDEMGHGDGLQVTARLHAHRPTAHALTPPPSISRPCVLPSLCRCASARMPTSTTPTSTSTAATG